MCQGELGHLFWLEVMINQRNVCFIPSIQKNEGDYYKDNKCIFELSCM